MSRLQRLKQAGFDLSAVVPFQREWRVKCSQCEATCINGVPCHETGCSNARHTQQEEEEEDSS